MYVRVCVVLPTWYSKLINEYCFHSLFQVHLAEHNIQHCLPVGVSEMLNVYSCMLNARLHDNNNCVKHLLNSTD